MNASEIQELGSWLHGLFKTASAEQCAYVMDRMGQFSYDAVKKAIDDHRAKSEFLNPPKLLTAFTENSTLPPDERRKAEIAAAQARDAARKAQEVERDNRYREIESAFVKLPPADFARKLSAAKESFPILKILDRPREQMGIGAMTLILKAEKKEAVPA